MDEEVQLLSDDEQQEIEVKASSQSSIPFLYAWGKNQDGELSLGNAKNANEPKSLKIPAGYTKEVQSAHTHSVMLTTDGQLYVTGSLLHDKLGLTKEVTNIFKFHVQPQLQSMKVKQVSCGAYHTLALVDTGRIYSWGGTLWGKTGQKTGTVSEIHMLSAHHIVEIACGDFHSVARSVKDDIFSWGGGGASKNKGQLGHSNFKDLQNPQQIQFFKGKRVKTIACGDYFTMALTHEDELYSWGEGNYGQLGIGDNEDTHTPKKVTIHYNNSLLFDDYFSRDSGKEKPKVQQIALGGKHSLILTNKGHLYVCGYGSQGQLGIGGTENLTKPTLVTSLAGKRVIMVAAGSVHSLALTDKNNVYCCGYNNKGQLGLGDGKSRVVWTHITALAGKRVSKIFGGGNHSWALLDRSSPFIEDYEPPSPIKQNISEEMGRSHEIPKIDNRSAVSNLTFIEALEDLSPQSNINHIPKSSLEVIYTDVDMHHRFIRFTSRDEGKVRSSMETFLNYCYEVQKGHLKFHRIQHDSDLYDRQGNLIAEADRKACTIMMVSDFMDVTIPNNIKNDNKVSIPIGEMAVLKEHHLRVDGKVPLHYRWFFKFGELFDGLIEKVRILELRPKLA